MRYLLNLRVREIRNQTLNVGSCVCLIRLHRGIDLFDQIRIGDLTRGRLVILALILPREQFKLMVNKRCEIRVISYTRAKGIEIVAFCHFHHNHHLLPFYIMIVPQKYSFFKDQIGQGEEVERRSPFDTINIPNNYVRIMWWLCEIMWFWCLMVLNFWSLVAVNSGVFSDTKPPKIDTKVSKKMLDKCRDLCYGKMKKSKKFSENFHKIFIGVSLDKLRSLRLTTTG